MYECQKLSLMSRNGHFEVVKNRSGARNSFGAINSGSKNYLTFSIKYGCNQLISISNKIFFVYFLNREFLAPNEFLAPDRFFVDLKVDIHGTLGFFGTLYIDTGHK